MAVAPTPARLERSRVLLAVGALSIAAGLLVAGTVSPNTGGVLLLAGWLATVGGLHFFGRSGGARGDE
jgi:hypothetical protein